MTHELVTPWARDPSATAEVADPSATAGFATAWGGNPEPQQPTAMPRLVAVIPFEGDQPPARLFLSTVDWSGEVAKWKALARKHEGEAKRPGRRRRHTTTEDAA